MGIYVKLLAFLTSAQAGDEPSPTSSGCFMHDERYPSAVSVHDSLLFSGWCSCVWGGGLQ